MPIANYFHYSNRSIAPLKALRRPRRGLSPDLHAPAIAAQLPHPTAITPHFVGSAGVTARQGPADRGVYPRARQAEPAEPGQARGVEQGKGSGVVDRVV